MYEADKEDENSSQEPQEQVIEPVEQEVIEFHGEDIIAVRLADGRIAVILRWICESLQLRPHGQVNRIRRTTAIAQELIRVRVETPRGGRQAMPALTLRGFPTWILGINPNEVEDKEGRQEETERIRNMIIAYQVEAVDVLYRHFAQKAAQHALALPEGNRAAVVVREAVTEFEPAKPTEPTQEADDQTLTTYYEGLAVWALWKASQHAQQWRGQVVEHLASLQTQLESEKAVTDIIPEILQRLGPELISTQQQRQVQAYVEQLNKASGKHPATIYNDLKTAFDCPRYQELRADEWKEVVNWFTIQIERARKRRE